MEWNSWTRPCVSIQSFSNTKLQNKLCRKYPPVLNPNYSILLILIKGWLGCWNKRPQNTMTWIKFQSSFLSSGTVSSSGLWEVVFGSETSSSCMFVLCQPLWLCFQEELFPHISCGNVCFSKSWEKLANKKTMTCHNFSMGIKDYKGKVVAIN